MAPLSVGVIAIAALTAPGFLDARNTPRPEVRRVSWLLLAASSIAAAAHLYLAAQDGPSLGTAAVVALFGGLLLATVVNDARQLSHTLTSYFVAPLLGFAVLLPSVDEQSGPLLAAALAGTAAGIPLALALRWVARKVVGFKSPGAAPAAQPRSRRHSVWTS